MDEPGFEPGTSTMPTWRSCQTDLLAQSIWLLRFNPRHLISVSSELAKRLEKGSIRLVSASDKITFYNAFANREAKQGATYAQS